MLFPWFLLSVVSTLAHSYSVFRHQPVDWETENPSCEQLRDFWMEVRRTLMVKPGPETNEIPLLPLNVAHYERILTGGFPVVSDKHSKAYRKNDMGTYINHLGLSKSSTAIQAPISPQLPFLILPKPGASPESSGIFGEFHEQTPDNSILSSNHGSGSSIPLGDKKNTDVNNEFYAPQWGLPSEIDSFGNFVDLDIRLLPPQRHLAVPRTPKEVKAGTWSDIIPTEDMQKNSLDACDVMVHSTCAVNEHCSCTGWKKLQCVDGKCLHNVQSDDVENKYGTWHDGPVPQTQLRLLPIPRKGHRSVFM